jgi:hypothetical protein
VEVGAAVAVERDELPVELLVRRESVRELRSGSAVSGAVRRGSGSTAPVLAMIVELARGAVRAVEENLVLAVVVYVAEVRLPAGRLSTGWLRAFLALELVVRLANDRSRIRPRAALCLRVVRGVWPAGSGRKRPSDDVIGRLTSLWRDTRSLRRGIRATHAPQKMRAPIRGCERNV